MAYRIRAIAGFGTTVAALETLRFEKNAGTGPPSFCCPSIRTAKTLKDSDFHREYRKVVGEDASPLMPEELTRAIQNTPRDAELIELFKAFSGPAPLPGR
jgi:hypothetical protein